LFYSFIPLYAFHILRLKIFQCREDKTNKPHFKWVRLYRCRKFYNFSMNLSLYLSYHISYIRFSRLKNHIRLLWHRKIVVFIRLTYFISISVVMQEDFTTILEKTKFYHWHKSHKWTYVCSISKKKMNFIRQYPKWTKSHNLFEKYWNFSSWRE